MLRLKLSHCTVAILVCFAITPTLAAQNSGATLPSVVAGAMARRRGTAVVISVQSGKLLAVYHSEVAARRLAHPGSSIKPFTLLALLESGKIGPQTALVCKRYVSISGRRLDCTHPETAQPVDPAAALAYSCNYYFTSVATRLTPEELRGSLLRAGFGSSTGLLAREVAGSVAIAQSPAQLQLQAIGEWGVNVTPIELLAAYRQLALLSGKQKPRLSPLFEGLEQSIAYGMGHPAKPADLKVAGKTGTSPAEDGPWTHAWFAGYAPANKPEIALVVFLEKGHGGTDAATTAREIFEAYAERTTAAAKDAKQ